MHEREPGPRSWPSPVSEVVRSLPTREGVAETAQRPLVLALLPVALPLGLLGLLLGLAGLGPLGSLLARLALPLLRPALGLLLLVAGEGPGGLLHSALGLIFHGCSFPSTFASSRYSNIHC